MDHSDLDLRQLFGLARRRFRLLLVTIGAVMLGTVLLLAMLRPLYTATALVLIDTAPRDLLADTAERASDGTRIESAVEILGSDATLLAVVDRLALAENAQFMANTTAPVAGARQAALQRLRDTTAVHRRGVTAVIAVSASNGTPELAAQLANGLAETFIDRQVQGRIDAVLAARAAVDARLAEAQAALALAAAAAPAVEGLADASASTFTQVQNLALARAQVQTLLTRRNQLGVQAGLQMTDTRIVSPAIVPAVPSSPNRPMILSIGAVLAVGLALALALLRENVVGGFVSEAQLRNVLRLRSTASLDRHRDTPRVDHPADLMIEAPLSPYAEAVRRIELVANQALRRQPRQEDRGDVVLITSVQDGEGKSTLALALARAHALAGRTALLIDCNLRQPALATLAGVRREFGLREYLDAPEGDVHLAGLLASDPQSQARLALGVTPSTGPTDHLLGGAALARMIDAARRSFDVVILDASPVTTVVDPLYLVAHADAVLLLVRYAETSQSHARAALSALYAAKPEGVEVVGVLARAEG